MAIERRSSGELALEYWRDSIWSHVIQLERE